MCVGTHYQESACIGLKSPTNIFCPIKNVNLQSKVHWLEMNMYDLFWKVSTRLWM